MPPARRCRPICWLGSRPASDGRVRSRQSGRMGQFQLSTSAAAGRSGFAGPSPSRHPAASVGDAEGRRALADGAPPRPERTRHGGSRRRPGAASDGDRAATRRIEVHPDDFRIVRFRQRTETSIVFAVDASGSTALHRLGEAKGAVELLLADCYVRRDHVALIAFRGRDATLLLPPTRSLTRAKRCLSGLPGGGATPLAAGIDAAADAGRRRAAPGPHAGHRFADRWAGEHDAGRSRRSSARREPKRWPARARRGTPGSWCCWWIPRPDPIRSLAPWRMSCTRVTSRCRAPMHRPCPGRFGPSRRHERAARLGYGWPRLAQSRVQPFRPRRRPALACPGDSGRTETEQRPTVLLLHGTGASTHSWRALAPLLARRLHRCRAGFAWSRLHRNAREGRRIFAPRRRVRDRRVASRAGSVADAGGRPFRRRRGGGAPVPGWRHRT